MGPVAALFVVLFVLLGLTAGVLAFVQRPLTKLLTEVCGNEDRGRFWIRLYSASLLLLVLWFSIWTPPAIGGESPALLGVIGMFRVGVSGLLLGLGLLAFLMLIFVARHDRRHPLPR